MVELELVNLFIRACSRSRFLARVRAKSGVARRPKGGLLTNMPTEGGSKTANSSVERPRRPLRLQPGEARMEILNRL